MRNIYNACAKAGETYYNDKNALVQGANIAGFEKVAEAMMAQGDVGQEPIPLGLHRRNVGTGDGETLLPSCG